jgi:hypothetical protein
MMTNKGYEIFKAETFPKRILNNTFVNYQLKEHYLAISNPHFTYLVLTEVDMNACVGDKVRYCPANKAVSDSRTDSCLIQLFLRNPEARTTCTRTITGTPPRPRMERRNTAVLYFFPEVTSVFIKCQHNGIWTSETMELEGAGFLQDARLCHITAGNLRLFADATGQTNLESDPPLIILPAATTLTVEHELQTLHNLSEFIKIDELLSTLSAHNVETSVDSLIMIKPLEPAPDPQFHWSIPLSIATPVVLITAVLYFCCKSHCAAIMKCNPLKAPTTHPERPGPEETPTSTEQQRRQLAAALPEMTSHRYSTYAVDQLSPV